MWYNRCEPTWYIAYQGLLFDGVIKKDLMYFNCIFYEIDVVVAVVCQRQKPEKLFIMQFVKNPTTFFSSFRIPPVLIGWHSLDENIS